MAARNMLAKMGRTVLGGQAKKPEDVKRPRCKRCGSWQRPARRFAFTAVLTSISDMAKMGFCLMPGYNWIIGRADEGTRGYSPVLIEGCFEKEEQARARAKELNALAGWTDEGEAQMMVLSTMCVRETEMERVIRLAATLLSDAKAKSLDREDVNEWLELADPYLKEQA